jgi:hypothetical protein
VGDPYLEKVLYGNVDTMAGKLGRNIAPEKTTFFSSFFKKTPPDNSSEAGKESYYSKPPSAPSLKTVDKGKKKEQPAPAKKPSSKISATDPKSLRDLEDKMKYIEAGVLGKGKSPYAVAGKIWNSRNAFYYSRGTITRGDRLNPKKVKAGTRVFIRKIRNNIK